MRLAFCREVVVRAFKVATFVGPILIVINQGDVILRGELNATCILKMGLTILVPYSVSTFSSVAAMKGCRTEEI